MCQGLSISLWFSQVPHLAIASLHYTVKMDHQINLLFLPHKSILILCLINFLCNTSVLDTFNVLSQVFYPPDVMSHMLIKGMLNAHKVLVKYVQVAWVVITLWRYISFERRYLLILVFCNTLFVFYLMSFYVADNTGLLFHYSTIMFSNLLATRYLRIKWLTAKTRFLTGGGKAISQLLQTIFFMRYDSCIVNVEHLSD